MRIPLPNGEITFDRNSLLTGSWALYVILRYADQEGETWRRPALGFVVKPVQGRLPSERWGKRKGRTILGLYFRTYGEASFRQRRQHDPL